MNSYTQIITRFQVLDLYQQPNPAGGESPPQLPASKASPPTTKRIPSSPLIKKSPNAAPSQTQVNAKPAAANPAPVPVQANESSLDNQPIPKLITTNENVHYSYASSYGALYGQQQQQQQYHNVTTGQMVTTTTIHTPVVQNNLYPTPNQYTQSTMPPTIQTANLQQFPQTNPAAAYYQPPPPPSAPRNYYHGPT